MGPLLLFILHHRRICHLLCIICTFSAVANSDFLLIATDVDIDVAIVVLILVQ